MNDEIMNSPSPEEARTALAEAERVIAEVRLAIARGPAASLLIIWGIIWFVADATIQFDAQAMQWIWWMLDLIGIAATWWCVARHRVQVRSKGGWRIGIFWGILFFYASLWMCLLVPFPELKTAGDWSQFEPVYRRLCAYMHTIPMFAYVVGGLWLGRFFVYLGALVTLLVVVGLWLVPDYYYLWLAVTGGGSLIVAGVFIRKFWK